jgi:hypothetical protein
VTQQNIYSFSLSYVSSTLVFKIIQKRKLQHVEIKGKRTKNWRKKKFFTQTFTMIKFFFQNQPHFLSFHDFSFTSCLIWFHIIRFCRSFHRKLFCIFFFFVVVVWTLNLMPPAPNEMRMKILSVSAQEKLSNIQFFSINVVGDYIINLLKHDDVTEF